MSARARTWAARQTVRGMRRATLNVLADYFNDTWGYACPSMSTLGERLGVTAKQARRHVLALERDGVVVVERIKGPHGRWVANRYHLPLGPAAGAPEPPARYSHEREYQRPQNGRPYSHIREAHTPIRGSNHTPIRGSNHTPTNGRETVIKEPLEEPLCAGAARPAHGAPSKFSLEHAPPPRAEPPSEAEPAAAETAPGGGFEWVPTAEYNRLARRSGPGGVATERTPREREALKREALARALAHMAQLGADASGHPEPGPEAPGEAVAEPSGHPEAPELAVARAGLSGMPVDLAARRAKRRAG